MTSPDIVSLSYGTVRYLFESPKESKGTILFVHGMSYPLEVWEPIRMLARSEGWSTLSYDLYGRGLSTYTGGKLSPETLAQQMEEILAHCDIHSWVRVVTLSNGDWVGLTWSVRNLQRCHSLSMIAPSGLDSRTMNWKMRSFAQMNFLHRYMNKNLRKKLAQRMSQHALHAPEHVPEYIRDIYDTSIKSVYENPDFCTAFWSQVANAYTIEQAYSLVKQLPAGLSIHTLRFVQEADSTEEGVSIFFGYSDLNDISIEFGTHMALLEEPEKIWKILRSLLS